MIVLHAGMPKAGSTTIQNWLQSQFEMLSDRGIVVMAPQDRGDAGVDFAPAAGSGVNASWLVRRAVESAAGERVQTIHTMFDRLADAADRYGTVVVSGEGLAVPFWNPSKVVLTKLEELSADRPVRVAYYARPQHTCLESTWCQWGHRTGTPPAAFMEKRAPLLRYAATRDAVRRMAPGIDFEPRPMRVDMLEGEDLVTDFARVFLDLEEVDGVGEWANRSLPLEVVNLLSWAPKGMLWDDVTDNRLMQALKGVLADAHIPAAEESELGRRVLRKYAAEKFGSENAELGWSDFVPPVENPDVPGLESLDSLWAPRASAAELALAFRLLDLVVR